MSEPFVGEIRPLGFNFAPRGWALCDGQLLPVSQNTALFSLLGTTYGGDGRTTFALPDLRGRAPMHYDNQYRQGYKNGTETVTLTTAELPSHSHPYHCTTDAADKKGPKDKVYGLGGAPIFTNTVSNTVSLDVDSVIPSGSGLPHENMQPSLTINYSIALVGLFPSRS